MPDYIIEPLDTSAESLFEAFVEFIQQEFPDWNPSEGQLDVIIGRYFSMQAAFTADMASRVQRAIYRYFGSSLANIPPLPGAQALGTIECNISPTDPDITFTLPYGTLVGVTDNNGDMQMFQTLTDIVAPPGVLYAQVDIQAIEIGAAADGLSGSVQFIELVDWISDASVIGSTAGGSDPEDDDTYIQRLTDNLALMAPRPILAQDFAIIARNVPGVWRAAVIDNFRPGTLDKQRITSNYTGGNFTLSFQGQTTDIIPATTDGPTLVDALDVLPNLSATDLIVTGGPLPGIPIDVTFTGRYAYQDVALIVANTTGLTGGSSFTITETAIGVAYGTDMENSIAISAIDKAGQPLPQATRDELITYLQSTRPQNFLITWVDPAYHTVDITYTAYIYPMQVPDSVEAIVHDNLSNYISPALWGTLPYSSGNRDWQPSSIIRYLELTTIVENSAGVNYTQSLTFGVDGSAQDTNNKSFPGSPFALTNPGVIIGTVLS
jgi:hypothetical protein